MWPVSEAQGNLLVPMPCPALRCTVHVPASDGTNHSNNCWAAAVPPCLCRTTSASGHT